MPRNYSVKDTIEMQKLKQEKATIQVVKEKIIPIRNSDPKETQEDNETITKNEPTKKSWFSKIGSWFKKWLHDVIMVSFTFLITEDLWEFF